MGKHDSHWCSPLSIELNLRNGRASQIFLSNLSFHVRSYIHISIYVCVGMDTHTHGPAHAQTHTISERLTDYINIDLLQDLVFSCLFSLLGQVKNLTQNSASLSLRLSLVSRSIQKWLLCKWTSRSHSFSQVPTPHLPSLPPPGYPVASTNLLFLNRTHFPLYKLVSPGFSVVIYVNIICPHPE